MNDNIKKAILERTTITITNDMIRDNHLVTSVNTHN